MQVKSRHADRSRAETESFTSKPGAPKGLKVLDISTIVATPTSAAFIADYGAQGTKIELPCTGDALRNFVSFDDGKSLQWKVTNRDTKLLTLNLRHPNSRPISVALLADADVLIDNFHPSTLDGWGWAQEALWQIHAHLVILHANWAAVTDVIYGCVNQVGEYSRNVARMASILAGLPVALPGATVNRLCSSGLNAVGTAARASKSGEAGRMIAGGVECMSRAPFVMPKAESAFSRCNTVYDTTIGWRFVNKLRKGGTVLSRCRKQMRTLPLTTRLIVRSSIA